MSIEKRYNKIYAESEHTFGAGEPEDAVRRVLETKSGGTALELAAGQGRNALFLAQNGFAVTAIDLSSAGIDTLIKHARDRGLTVEGRVGDVRTAEIAGQYDVLVCTYALHHMSQGEAAALIGRMMEHTNPDGINVITAFTRDGDFYRDDTSTTQMFLEHDELKNMYAGWEILFYEESEHAALDVRPDGTPKRNVVAKLVARKPQ